MGALQTTLTKVGPVLTPLSTSAAARHSKLSSGVVEGACWQDSHVRNVPVTRRTSNCQVGPLPVMSSDLSSRRLEVTICHTEAIISIFKPFTILKKYTEVLKTVNILLRMYSHHLLSSHLYLARRSSHTPSGRLAHGF